MHITLDRLPFDVLFYVTSHLEFDDIVSLAHTCRLLRSLLQDNGICRKAVESQFQFTKEALLARGGHISYCDAFRCIQDRRNAFWTAYPFSASVIGSANEFKYRQGMLCIREGSSIRVYDVHSRTGCVTIDLAPILDASPQSSASSRELKLSMLFYNDDIVTIYCENKGQPNSDRILAISTKPEISGPSRLVKKVLLESTHKLFARHTSRYLYYGTYSSVGSQGHYEWEIRGISLGNNNTNNNPTFPYNNLLQLHGFFGTDIGSTIAFEVDKDYFYAVSNQTSFEVEEIDWTSFYHCVRFPLNNPKPALMESNNKLWRRQHDEGVIHDSWTDLSIQIDESTESPLIVEARREYQKSCGRQVRTYYISEFISSPGSPVASAEGSPVLEASTGPMLPWDDAYVQTLDSTNHPNYALAEPRYNWSFHPEVPRRTTLDRSFILARTKLRAYNYSSASFLDLVEDDRCCSDPSASCLRLRIGSRRAAPPDSKPLEETMPQLLSPPALPDDVAYRHSRIGMWPPPASRCACSRRLHNILNPPLPGGPARSRTITGTLDERSLVYMISPGRWYSSSDDHALGVVVAISFNRGPLAPRTTEDKAYGFPGRPDDDLEWHWQPGACRNRTCR